MILLSGHSLTAVRKVPAEAMSLTLNERESSATFTPRDLSGISVGSWLKDDRKPGNGIVWRVRSITQTFLDDMPQIALEHAVNTLRDRILFGEITPATITGTVGATTCTAKQAVQYILNQQSDWTLGTFDFASVSNPYHFDGDTLYDALETVSNSLTDAWWSYDFSTYPFRLNITAKSAAVGTILRAGRNLSAVSKTIDMAGMYTRFYPIGKDDLHISGNYVSRNENIYGAIAKVEVDTSLTTTAELTAWANDRLRVHAEPKVTINVNGFELADATGESLDALELGKKCRIPLPEYGTEITETITQLVYQDKIYQPEVVQITLANTKTDVTRIIADAIKQAGAGGRGGARQEKEDHAWFEDTDEYVAMVAQKTGINELGQGETLYSRLQVEAGRITSEVNRATQSEGLLNQGLVEQSSRITQTADAIQAEVTRASTAEGTLSGQITVQAGQISQIVQAVGRNGEVTAASIVLAINSSGSGAYINADRIILSGSTSINDVMYITSGGATAFGGQVAFLNTVSAYQGVTLIGLSPITVTSSNMATAIQKAEVTGSGANMTLKLTTFDGSEINFTKAATTSLTESWSGGTITVEAQPSGVTLQRTLAAGTTTWSGNTATVPINATWGSGTTYTESTGKNIYVDASARYTAGYDSAHLSGSWGTGSNSNLFTITKVQSGSSNSLSVRVKAAISYDSSTHKYTAKALANDIQKATAVSGTEAYTAGVNAVTVSSVAVYGSPAATATAISVQATASNGATKIGSISITSQRNNAYNSGVSSVTIPTNTAPAGTAESATITATASNGATKTCTVTAANAGFAGGGTYAQVKIGSTVIARQWVSLPSSATWSSYWPASNVISVTCNVGGKAYTQSFTR